MRKLYTASIELLAEGGRKTPLSYSPFLCFLKFVSDEEIGYSCELIFDSSSEWQLGETRKVQVGFAWDQLPFSFDTAKFTLMDGNQFGQGTLYI